MGNSEGFKAALFLAMLYYVGKTCCQLLILVVRIGMVAWLWVCDFLEANPHLYGKGIDLIAELKKKQEQLKQLRRQNK